MKITIDSDRVIQGAFRMISKEQDFFPPTKSLLSLPIVRYVIMFLFCTALLMWLGIITSSNNLDWAFDQKGYQVAAELFKAPISILLLSIPLLALLASNHRSVQTMSQMSLTTKQIDMTNNQNLFANYYKHVDEFAKWCEHLKDLANIESKRKLHGKLFPEAQAGDFSIPADPILEFENFAKSIRDLLLAAAATDSVDEIARLRIVTLDFSRSFWIKTLTYDRGIESILLQKGGRLYLPEDGLQGFVRQHINFIKVVDEIFSFDPDYRSSTLVTKLINLSLSTLPTQKSDAYRINFPELN